MLSKDYRTLLLMQQTLNALRKARRQELLSHGLTLEEFMILYIIHDAEGPVTPIRITHLLFQEPNTASVKLDRLMKKGLVRKIRNFRNDRRLTRVTITSKGRSIFEKVQKAQAAKGGGKGALSSIFSSLSGEEYEKLFALLLKLRGKALEEIGGKWKPPVP